MPAARPRIIVVAHDIEKSGAPRLATRMVGLLAARGFCVRACYPARGGCEEDARRAGIKTIVIPNPAEPFGRGSLARRLGLAIARMISFCRFWRLFRRADVDAVWIVSYVAVLAGVAARLAGKPVLFNIQEDVVSTRANRLRVRLVRWSASALSFAARQTVPPFRPKRPGTIWAYLPNFTEADRYANAGPRDDALRDQLGAMPGDVVFVTVAFVSRRKGIDVLLEAFREVRRVLPAARLWIAGDNVPTELEYRRALDQRVTEAGLGEAVSFLGHREDIPEVLAAADVFVLASRNEAAPLTIIEAMLARRPVVAANAGSVCDMVAEGRTGFVVPSEDVHALAARMLELGRSDSMRRQFGAAGQRRARRLFMPDAAADRAGRLIRRVLADTRG
ncbi:glycosyltransferase family 4 protein [Candidatus Poribacteria bacterium]|nr:glycosyltransferase family 4 protein [Candidatus Poribacteria bacterium]